MVMTFQKSSPHNIMYKIVALCMFVVLIMVIVWRTTTISTFKRTPDCVNLANHALLYEKLEENETYCDLFFRRDTIQHNLKEDKYTVIMPTFRRTDILRTVLRHYCDFTEIDKIILVWNNVNDRPPYNIGRELKCKCDITVLRQEKNLITNRFRPISYVGTEG